LEILGIFIGVELSFRSATWFNIHGAWMSAHADYT
jgi:hypothetical protein